jgi:hypothetical protein
MNNPLSPTTWLNLPLISRVRRNHALEHATMNVLAERYRGLRIVGRSSPWGFYVYGEVPTAGLLAAAQEGLRRLQAGQRQLAVHPACGTNLAAAGILAGTGAFLALEVLGIRRRNRLWDRLASLPLVCTVAMLGIMLAQPLGVALQARITTDADVGDMRIAGVTWERKGSLLIHHVRTEG